MKYLARNKPVFVKDGCKNWDGIEKWKNGTYLRGHAMLTQSYNAMYDKENGLNNYNRETTQEDVDNMLKGIGEIAQVGLKGMFNNSQGMPYMKNLWLNNNDLFKKDFSIPGFINSTILLEDLWFSYTSTGTNRETKGKAR